MTPTGSVTCNEMILAMLDPGVTRGNRAAFEELFRKFYRPVLNFFARRGCSEEECPDLTQETFLRAFRSFHRFRGDAKPLTWVLTIATNIWRNHVRDASAAKRAGREVSLPQGEAGPASDDRPQDHAIEREQRRLLESAIENLPPQMRRCVSLRVYQGMGFGDIAAVLGVSPATAKSQFSRAKSKLRSILAEHYPNLDADLDDREG